MISTSIVAVGAVLDLVFMGMERFGAKAEERREEIFAASQVLVMLSGNSLHSHSLACAF